MSGAQSASKEVDIDIAGLMGEVWKKKWLVLIISLIMGGLIFVGTSMVSPRYKTSASILIEKSKSYLAREKESLNIASDLDADAIGSQVQVLLSDRVALAVIDKLDLTNDKDFASKAKPSFLEGLLGGDSEGISSDERILKAFKERLQVYSALNSRMIKVEFWAHSPALAQKVANAVGEEYMDLKDAEKSTANDEAKKYLVPEIAALKNEVDIAQKRVADFRASSDMALGVNNAYLATQQLSEVSTELSRTKAERATAEATIASIRKALKTGASLDAVPDVISNPLIQRLLERQVTLRAQISDLSATLLPNHPKLKAMKSQLNDYDRQIRLTAGNILTSLQNNVVIARQREIDLTAEVARLKAESSRVEEAEVELNALKREAEIKEERLKERMASFGNASSSVTANILPVNAKFFPAAKPSEHYFPKVIPFTIAGMVVAMILSIVGILAWALLSGKAFKNVGEVTPDMVPEQVAMPMQQQQQVAMGQHELPMQPVAMGGAAMAGAEMAAHHGVHAPQVVALSNTPQQVQHQAPGMVTPYNTQAESNMVMQDELLSVLTMFDRAVLAFVSPGGEAGSLDTVRISRQLADEGRSVAVVDLSGSGVVTDSMLGTDQVPGIFEILSGAHVVDTTIYKDRASNCHVVAAGMEHKQPDGMTLNRLKNMMDKLEINYDFVVVDCGLVNIESLAKFGNKETVVVINSRQADLAKCGELEQKAVKQGYVESIILTDQTAGVEPIAA